MSKRWGPVHAASAADTSKDNLGTFDIHFVENGEAWTFNTNDTGTVLVQIPMTEQMSARTDSLKVYNVVTSTDETASLVDMNATVDGNNIVFETSHFSDYAVMADKATCTNHTLEPTAAVARTCTTAGAKAYWTCSTCGKHFSDEAATAEIADLQAWLAQGGDGYVAPLDHTAVTDAAKDATCTETGLTEGSHCGVCGATIVAQETVPALGHDMVETAAEDATCTEAGTLGYFTCSRCGKVFEDEAGGTETTVEKRVVKAKGHTAVTDAAVPATCTQTGLTEGSHCGVCNAVIKAQETTPILVHSMTETPAKAATATEAGTLGYWTCSLCGKVFADADGKVETTAADRAIPALGQHAAKRLAGDNAYGTMTSIVDEGWTSCDKVILATFDGYWDALAASGLAGIYGCPVLLTDTNSLSSAAQAEISRLGASTVVIVGGTAAVSANVQAQVEALGCAVERYAGDTAVGTAVAIYNAGRGHWGKTCVVATVNGYYDALSASPYAYAEGAPIFLANPDGSVSAEVAAAIAAGGFTSIVVAGGTACVTDAAASALASATGAGIQRCAGENCFGTSVALAKLCLDDGMAMTNVCFATGLDGYWDALAGAALAGKMGSPLLLVDDGYEDVLSVVSANKASVSQPYIFGGTAAVSSSTEAKINAAIK